jgi:hypothetical protein
MTVKLSSKKNRDETEKERKGKKKKSKTGREVKRWQ